MWLLTVLLVVYISKQSTSYAQLTDCDSPALSVKSRSLCRKQQMEVALVAAAPTADWWDEVARNKHFKASKVDNEGIFEPSTPRASTTAEKLNQTPEPFYVTTTPDPFADVPEIDNLDIFGNETLPCGGQDVQDGDTCKNNSQPIIRWKDPVFEKLLTQIWNDQQAKITVDKSIKGIALDPLIIDPLIPGGKMSVNQTSSFYGAKLAVWDIQIHGLSTIRMIQALVTRASDLSDLEMSVTFSFSSMSANGTYDLDGWMGWAAVHSGGPQPFDAEIINATLTARITLDTTVGDGSGCGQDGGVLITDLGIPLNYDDISFNFHNIGAFYNTMVNGVGIYLLKMQETNLVGALKDKIWEDVNSLLC